MKTQPQILVVEHDAPILDLVKDILAPSYSILTAEDALQGVDLLQSEPVDLLMIDAVLPVLSGADLIRILRKHPPFSQLPIIAFPHHLEKLYPLDPAQVQAILPKPFSINTLARTVADTLQRSNWQASIPPALELPRYLSI